MAASGRSACAFVAGWLCLALAAAGAAIACAPSCAHADDTVAFEQAAANDARESDAEPAIGQGVASQRIAASSGVPETRMLDAAAVLGSRAAAAKGFARVVPPAIDDDGVAAARGAVTAAAATAKAAFAAPACARPVHSRE